MKDIHVHIGQFADAYYEPLAVIDIVMASGMEGLSFSSTTSCKDDVHYREVEKEITLVYAGAAYSSETIRPFLWFTPDYIRQGVSAESACGGIPYKGIKIHPLANSWNLEDLKHRDALHRLFDYAALNALPVLIHTGESGVDSPDRFERFFGAYPCVQIILAHGRPAETTVAMLRKYPNLYCDTAFAPEERFARIVEAGFASRIILGSDFPITHYFRTKYPGDNEELSISPKEQYAKDVAQMKEYEKRTIPPACLKTRDISQLPTLDDGRLVNLT
jgi:hypothetical protein